MITDTSFHIYRLFYRPLYFEIPRPRYTVAYRAKIMTAINTKTASFPSASFATTARTRWNIWPIRCIAPKQIVRSAFSTRHLVLTIRIGEYLRYQLFLKTCLQYIIRDVYFSYVRVHYNCRDAVTMPTFAPLNHSRHWYPSATEFFPQLR